jgi:hypothetical protein
MKEDKDIWDTGILVKWVSLEPSLDQAPKMLLFW